MKVDRIFDIKCSIAYSYEEDEVMDEEQVILFVENALTIRRGEHRRGVESYVYDVNVSPSQF